MKKLIILIFTFLLIFTSCKDCEDNSEPIAKIFFREGFVEFDKVKGLNSDSIIDFFNYNEGYPLSIISDTTTLLFYGAESTDTLSIQYKRNFSFESKKCGFTVTLSDFENLGATTFDSVSFEIRESSYEYPVELKKNEYVIEIFN